MAVRGINHLCSSSHCRLQKSYYLKSFILRFLESELFAVYNNRKVQASGGKKLSKQNCVIIIIFDADRANLWSFTYRPTILCWVKNFFSFWYVIGMVIRVYTICYLLLIGEEQILCLTVLIQRNIDSIPYFHIDIVWNNWVTKRERVIERYLRNDVDALMPQRHRSVGRCTCWPQSGWSLVKLKVL